MVNNIWNNKVALIIYKKDMKQFGIFQKNVEKLICSEKFTVETIIANGKDMASAYMVATKKTDAFCKIYISNHVLNLAENIIRIITDVKAVCQNTGIVGNFGYSVPFDGDIKQSKNHCGKYAYVNKKGKTKEVRAENPLFYQKVHAVDSSFFCYFWRFCN